MGQAKIHKDFNADYELTNNEKNRRIDRSMDRIAKLADLLDNRYRIPGTPIRVGWDPIIGLIPVVGDTLTAGLGGFIVREAIRLGARKRVILRMLFNLFLDWLIGLVPFIDILLDMGFKANAKNARLLVREWEAGRLKKVPRSSNGFQVESER
ncbi:MAG: DUF4112 domain-containing protein [Candidatus Omnitrophica bacterium]|nr:DUF4112 domain-containing protein [Candidatus Omnitrophota bacterium]